MIYADIIEEPRRPCECCSRLRATVYLHVHPSHFVSTYADVAEEPRQPCERRSLGGCGEEGIIRRRGLPLKVQILAEPRLGLRSVDGLFSCTLVHFNVEYYTVGRIYTTVGAAWQGVPQRCKCCSQGIC